MSKTDPKPIHRCYYCDTPGAEHEGGYLTEHGESSGYFCNKECFGKWLKVRSLIGPAIKKERK